MFSELGNQDVPQDFNFLIGQWRVENKMLTKRLEGSHDWKMFEANHEGYSLLSELGVIDQMTGLDGTPIGSSLRFFNREMRQWYIYWVSYRDGIMQPPVIGNFKDGIGIFEGEDTWNGNPIIVRFVWSNTHTETPRWEQFFSSDNGQTWEKNWEMNFTRG
mgnify:CR=1 FL=1